MNITSLTNMILNLVLAFILSSVVVSAQPPWARGGQGGPGGGANMPNMPNMEDRFARLLNLTDAQKTQIKALREQAQTASQPYFEQIKPLNEALHKLIEAPAFDEAAARALTAQMAQIQVELRMIQAKTEAAIYQLLTPEQRAKLAELRQAMEDGQGGPPNGGGGRRGGSGRPGN